MVHHVAQRSGGELVKKAAMASTPLLAAKGTAVAALATNPVTVAALATNPVTLVVGAVAVGSYLIYKSTKK